MYSEFHSTHREKRDHAYASFSLSGRLQNIQKNGTKKLSGQKVVTIAYERWSFTSVEVLNFRALTGKVMVVWMGGCT